jgi:hypothetical protein
LVRGTPRPLQLSGDPVQPADLVRICEQEQVRHAAGGADRKEGRSGALRGRLKAAELGGMQMFFKQQGARMRLE